MTVTAASAADPAGPPVAGRRRHGARWVAVVALVVGAGLVAVLATRPPATATEASSPLLGLPAPSITGTTLSGQHFDLQSLHGRWVVVNFFASWCSPCQLEEPELVTFAFDHRAPTSAALVGVVFDDATSSARSYLSSTGATWPALADPGGQIALSYGVRAPPETFIVSPAGRVVVYLVGPVTAAGLDYWLQRAARGST